MGSVDDVVSIDDAGSMDDVGQWMMLGPLLTLPITSTTDYIGYFYFKM